jgi:hypothetical protein
VFNKVSLTLEKILNHLLSFHILKHELPLKPYRVGSVPFLPGGPYRTFLQSLCSKWMLHFSPWKSYVIVSVLCARTMMEIFFGFMNWQDDDLNIYLHNNFVVNRINKKNLLKLGWLCFSLIWISVRSILLFKLYWL